MFIFPLKHYEYPFITTHQSLVSKGVVYAPHEEPERPEVLKPEFKYKVCKQHQCPHHQELQVQEGTIKRKLKQLDFSMISFDNNAHLYSLHFTWYSHAYCYVRDDSSVRGVPVACMAD